MSKKTIIILIVITLFTVLVFSGLRFFSKPQPGKQKEIETEIIKEPTPLTLQELKEKLLKGAEVSLSGPEVLIVLESEKEGSFGRPRFSIQYQVLFDLFHISLYDKPLVEVRREAEEALLEKAEGQLDALCQLNVLFGSPYFISGDEILENRESLNICNE